MDYIHGLITAKHHRLRYRSVVPISYVVDSIEWEGFLGGGGEPFSGL